MSKKGHEVGICIHSNNSFCFNKSEELKEFFRAPAVLLHDWVGCLAFHCGALLMSVCGDTTTKV